MYGFIYITTNNINGKKYIGQKVYSNNWKNYLGSGIHLKRAIKKYGKKNFTREIIDEAEDKKQLDEKEKYWISYYNAVNSDKFYNIAEGGDGGNTRLGYTEEEFSLSEQKRICKVKESTSKRYGENSSMHKLKEEDVKGIISDLLNNEYLKDIALKYNISKETVRDIYNHVTWKYLTKNIDFPKQKRDTRIGNKKAVKQYNINGKLLSVYESAKEAETKTNINRKLIFKSCNGENTKAGGFVWRYYNDEFNKYPIDNPHFVPIIQYSLDGEKIKRYSSIKDAINIYGKSISSVIQGRTKSAYGFYWVKEGEDFKIPEYKRNM